MHLRTIIRKIARPVLTRHEKTTQRSESDFFRTFAKEQTRFHFHGSVAAGFDDEAIGPGQTRAVQQRVQPHPTGQCMRLFQPKLRKARKLLPRRFPRINRQAANGGAISLCLAEHAKVAGPHKLRHFIHLLLRVQWIEQAKAAELQRRGQILWNTAFLVVKLLRRERHVAHPPAVNDVNFDWILVQITSLKKLGNEAHMVILP